MDRASSTGSGFAPKLVGLPDHVEEFVDAAIDASDDRLVALGHPLFDEKGDLGELVEDRPARPRSGAQ